jgi:filamentous hemagglutinin
MNNAVNQSGILSLEIGKALTQSQLANLSEDIVWMEEKIVDEQKVLVPVVYLAKDYEHLKGASIVAQKGIDLKVKDSLNNSGNIKSKDYLNLNANSIINNAGVILSNGKATLVSQNDFLNKNGGIIKASDVQIASINGDIINQTFFQQNTINNGNNFTYTQIGKQSQIEATNGNLVLQANNNIENIGSKLSASKNLSLNAINGDVNLKTIELKNEHNIYYGGGFNKALDIEYLSSNVYAENVLIKAGKDINLEASKLNANNQINLNAANDVNITAVNDVHYKDVQTTSKGFMSKKTQRDMSYKEEVNSAELNAKDIVINAQNDVNLEAAKLKAQDNIEVFAKEGDVNVLAKTYKEGELHQTSKSSWGGLKKSLDIKSNDALRLNSALLETQAANVVLRSGKDINILASEINSGNSLLANAKNNLNIMSDEEIFKKEELHKKTSFSPSFSGNMLVLAQEKTTSDKNANTTQISSNLSGKEVMLQAQNEMNIIGSNVVGDDVILKSNDINLLSATQSASNEQSESTKKIGIEVTLNTKEASIFAGGITNKDKINKGNTTQLASNILGDNVTLISTDSTNVLASNILANNDLIIAGGKNINILSGEAIDYKDEIHTYLKAGVSLGVKQNVTDGVKNIANITENIANSDNVANAGFGALKLIDTVSSTLSNPVSAGLNAVAIVNKNTSSITNQTVQSSNIYSGNDATFDAKEDINIKGSSVYVKNDLDIYAKNLNIEAGKETSNSKTTDKNMDLTVGLYGTNMGKVDVSLSLSKALNPNETKENSKMMEAL